MDKEKPQNESGRCPVGEMYEPFSAASTYDIFAQARVEEPVFYCAEIDYWVITKRKDIDDIFQDPESYSAQITLSPVTPFTDEVLATLKEGGFAAQPVQSNLDGEAHTRIRRSSKQLLNPTAFKKLEPDIRRIAQEFIDRFASKSEVDLVAELFYEFPAHILFLILGIPDSDVGKIKQWADNRLFLTFGQLAPAEQLKCAKDMVAYWHYTEALVAQRAVAPADDYPSHLLRLRNSDDSILTHNEIVSVVFGLLLAGHETTTNASANAFHTLLTHRKNWQMICADPELIPNAVHEALRFNSSVVCWRRKTTKAVDISGVSIPEGANLLLALGSANRDEDKFEQGHVFDVMREDANQNISFGYGKHFCVGAPLARLEMEVLLEEMTSRFPNMSLVEDQEIDIIRTIAFRGPKRLLVRLQG
ncbi:MAG: cytochrome P450 [Gammaproteobacteria bacterium]|nr:cytochrome P450 [Gammaproteobacteria bacterium]